MYLIEFQEKTGSLYKITSTKIQISLDICHIQKLLTTVDKCIKNGMQNGKFITKTPVMVYNITQGSFVRFCNIYHFNIREKPLMNNRLMSWWEPGSQYIYTHTNLRRGERVRRRQGPGRLPAGSIKP